MEEDFEGYSSLWAHINLGLFSYFLDIFDASCILYVSEKNYLGKSLIFNATA